MTAKTKSKSKSRARAIAVVADSDSLAPVEEQPRHTSALEAAVLVLNQATEPLSSKQLIAVMAEQGIWTSPTGKTPHATLYSALLREIKLKGSSSRFQMPAPGKLSRA